MYSIAVCAGWALIKHIAFDCQQTWIIEPTDMWTNRGLEITQDTLSTCSIATVDTQSHCFHHKQWEWASIAYWVTNFFEEASYNCRISSPLLDQCTNSGYNAQLEPPWVFYTFTVVQFVVKSAYINKVYSKQYSQMYNLYTQLSMTFTWEWTMEQFWCSLTD